MNKERLDKLVHGFNVFIGILLLGWIILENMVVFNRYILKVSVSWSEEVFVLMFNWFIFIGTALASVDDKHIAITMLTDALHGKKKLILQIIQNILFGIFIAVVCVQSWKIFAIQQKTGQITAILNIPVFYTTLAMCVGSVAWLAIVICKTIFCAKQLKTTEGN